MPFNPVRLMNVSNTEIAPVTATSPFNTVRLMVTKILYHKSLNGLLFVKLSNASLNESTVIWDLIHCKKKSFKINYFHFVSIILSQP